MKRGTLRTVSTISFLPRPGRFRLLITGTRSTVRGLNLELFAAARSCLIAGLLYLLCFEHVDNLGNYSIPSETGLLIPSASPDTATGDQSWLTEPTSGHRFDHPSFRSPRSKVRCGRAPRSLHAPGHSATGSPTASASRSPTRSGCAAACRTLLFTSVTLVFAIFCFSVSTHSEESESRRRTKTAPSARIWQRPSLRLARLGAGILATRHIAGRSVPAFDGS